MREYIKVNKNVMNQCEEAIFEKIKRKFRVRMAKIRMVQSESSQKWAQIDQSLYGQSGIGLLYLYSILIIKFS